MDVVFDTIGRSFGNYNFPIIYLFFLLLGIIICAGKRKLFFVPAVLITVAVVNPILMKITNNADQGNVYWRTFWIVPIIPVLAVVLSDIIDKKTNVRNAVMLIFGMPVILLFSGSYIFSNPATTFAMSVNPEKLPEEVVEIGGYLLDIDEDPYVVSDAEISTYLRQFSGKIRSPYSRSVSYGMPTALGQKCYSCLIANEMDKLALVMSNYDYEYLVTLNENCDKKEKLEKAGFKLLNQIGQYGIYQVNYQKTEVRTYNAEHQVTSVAYYNEDGEPMALEGKPYSRYELDYIAYYSPPITSYYDLNNQLLKMGGYYFLEYLKELKSKNCIIFISIMDEGTEALNERFQDALSQLGIQSNLLGKTRYSFYAVIDNKNVKEEIGRKALSYSGTVRGVDYSIRSAGFDVGNVSSIIINGIEYSQQSRGMNIVVYDPEERRVIDSVVFDTCSIEMTVKR